MSDYISPVIVDSAHVRLRAGTRKAVFEFLALDAAGFTGMPAPQHINDILSAAEMQAPSAIGNGVALPHLRLPGIGRPYMIAATLARPVAFDTPDGQPVDIVFLLISPESDGPLHLQRLSRVSRMLKNEGLCDDMRHAATTDQLHAILSCTRQERLAA